MDTVNVTPVVNEPQDFAHGNTELARVWDWLVGPGYADPRVRDWPLLDGRIALAISCAYVFGIPLGLRLMSKRQPFNMTKFAMVHNGFLFFLSLYMLIETLRQAYINFGWGNHFRLWCNPSDPRPNFSPSGYSLARILWIHYLSKAYEFVDTIIMVLRKKTQQITFLHIYHHATTFFPVWWAVLVYGPGGEPYFCCALNSFIHVVMYGYYFATTLRVKLTGIKPFITYSQMLQFLSFIAQGVYLLVKDCYKPRLTVVFLVFQCVMFFTLFTDFAVKTYWRPQSRLKTV